MRHRRLWRIPQKSAHRGWFARHGGRPAADASAAPEEQGEGPGFPLSVVADPEVAEAARADAAAAVRHVARFAPTPVTRARVALRHRHDPAAARPATVKASVELSGHVVRAHAEAATFPDAIDLVERRLRRNVDELRERLASRRHGGPG